jgi:FAD/FMN-containing dehydrogenase
MTDHLTAFASLLGADAVVAGPEIEPRYRQEFFSTTPIPCQPRLLLKPRDTAGVAAALRYCHEHRLPVAVQGGMTGLSGGALPNDGEVLLSLERLRGIEELDVAAGTLTVLAGTPLQEAQAAAEAAGFLLAIDLGARGTCQVAGNVSTNAGGNRVIRYGMTRQQVLGLEAVLADGTVLSSLNKMLKNNAGYDLKHLFIGSEGTLGVVTRVVFRLEPLPTATQTAFCAVPSYAAVVRLLRHAQQRLAGRLSAFEVMWRDYYEFAIRRVPGRRAPLSTETPFYILLDLQGADAETDGAAFAAMLESALEEKMIVDAAIAASAREAQDFWHIRDAPGDFTKVWPQLISFDVSLPIGSIGEFVEKLTPRLQAAFPGCEAVNFGHIGDSNLHVCAAIPGTTPETFPAKGIKDCLYTLLRDYGGSVTAEHGVGTEKKDYLAYCRSPEEIALMRTLKAALDPHGILNPGRVL